MGGHIFINYRRDDSSASAGRLYDRLSSHFSANQIFFDIDNLPLGVDFAEVIQEYVSSCDVLLAVIGRRWISSHEGGKRRLDNPDDFVRIEIAAALKRNIRVIPVLVDGAVMPSPRDLPDELKPLARRNALELSHKRFNADLEQLIAALERALAKTTAEREERQRGEQLSETDREKRGAGRRGTQEVGKLTIPPHLLGSAEPGSALRLTPEAEPNEQLLARFGNCFRIGRSAEAGADLVTRFFPSNEANDTKTKRLSRIHVTCKCENGQIYLFDGNGVSPSGNGSKFGEHVLLTGTPLALRDPGVLRLADVYSIKIVPQMTDRDDAPAIANLGDWSGPIREVKPPVAGAILFLPNSPSEFELALWLFSVAPFGGSDVSPLNFTLPAGEMEVGALRYFCECFWIEQRSARSVSVDGLVLAPAQVAPLVTGQTLEINGRRYDVEIA